MFLPLDPAGGLLSPFLRFVPLRNKFMATPLKERKDKEGKKRENVRGSRGRGPFGVGRGRKGGRWAEREKRGRK